MDYFGKPCPVCSRTFREGDDIVVCPRCGTPYHRECYTEKGKCIRTDLHQSGKSWSEEDEQKEKESAPDNAAVCPRCGTKNPPNAIVCQKCGSFLAREFDRDNPPAYTRPAGGQPGSAPYGQPFAVFLDPMGGVSPEEDFDGVNGAELSKYVNSNTAYYMPTFSKIKNQNKGRFNLCAFLFTAGWYLYRKQYLKGALLAGVYLLLELATVILAYRFSYPLMEEAKQALSGMNQVSATELVRWAMEHKSTGEMLLMLLPYLMSLPIIGMRLLCGFRGNRSYYKTAVRRIKKAKEATPAGEDTMKAISEAGGVNTPLAWTIFACCLILYFTIGMI